MLVKVLTMIQTFFSLHWRKMLLLLGMYAMGQIFGPGLIVPTLNFSAATVMPVIPAAA